MNIIKSEKNLKYLASLDYPEITINKGDFVFIIGKSGSGKSTYLKLLNRTILPISGNIYYQSNNINDIPILKYRKEVLLVPQDVFLLDESIKDNFKFYYENRVEALIDDQKIKKYLEICCLNLPINSNCKNLSGGERQRVFLAIFLSCAKSVMLLDEPTSSLDEATAKTLLKNIKNYAKANKITVVCVDHNNELVDLFKDKVIRIGDNNA